MTISASTAARTCGKANGVPPVEGPSNVRICIWWGLREGKDQDLSPGRDRLINPHDVEARCGGKCGMVRDGCKVHCSKTCEGGLPHLVVNVATTHAAVDDSRLIDSVRENLERCGTRPGGHLADAGRTFAAIILTARADSPSARGTSSSRPPARSETRRHRPRETARRVS
ncbi:hypothetical protein ACIO3L_39270, partial [Streptomyces sp. NPDC087437]